MEEIIIKKDQDSLSRSVELVSDYLENYKYDNLLSYLKDIHNADIADILQDDLKVITNCISRFRLPREGCVVG